MKRNICITGLLNNFSAEVTKSLADKLEMFFADVVKMIEFDIIDVGSTINIMGLDYYKNLIRKKIKEVSTFEDTITYLDYYILNYENCQEVLSDFLKIYLKVDKRFYKKNLIKENKSELQVKLEKNVFLFRNRYLTKKCDIVINCSKKTEEQILEEIQEKILKYYSKG